MTLLNYPRLCASDASRLVIELADVDPAERVELGRAYRGRATAYATAVNLAGDEHLNELRKAVLQLAEHCGFPDSPPTAGFDDGLPLLLGNCMKISPVEAGCTEVWNYLSLVLLPDVAVWRWPNEKRNPSYERLIGKPRNVLRRHWWRWYLLGEELSRRMNEDELVAIVERSASLGGDPRVARAVAAAFLDYVDTRQLRIDGELRSLQRMVLMRDLAKRVLRIGKVVALSTLDDLNIRSLGEELIELAGEAQAARRNGVIMRVRESDSSGEVQSTRAVGAARIDPEALLNQELERIVDRAGVELDVSTTAMRRMLADFGGLEAARRVVLDPDGDWFAAVTAEGRPDFSIEALVSRDPFSTVFTAEEIASAQARLAENDRLMKGGATADDLADALDRLNRRAEQATGFRLSALGQMVSELGSVATVARLVGSPDASDGFVQLARRGRLDLTVETLALDRRYASLFDVDVLRAARDRLDRETAKSSSVDG